MQTSTPAGDDVRCSRVIRPDEVATFVREYLMAPERSQPLVAITTDPRLGRSRLDSGRLAGALGDSAEVVELETGEATWALAEALPPRLDVYGGAARIWWPGLTTDSDPYEHRLYFVRTGGDAERVFDQIVAAVANSVESDDAHTPDPAAPVDRLVEPTETVRVTAVRPGRIEVTSGMRRGVVVAADLPINLIAESLVVDVQLEARPVRPQGDGTWAYSLEGTLPNPWQILDTELGVDDIVVGRVQNIRHDKGLVFVDVLPGVVGVWHVSELDYHHVARIEEFVKVGELLPFRILDLDVQEMRLQLSRKAAFGDVPRASPSLVPGGKPFVWRDDMPMFESLRRATRRRGERSTLRVLGGRVRAPEPTAQTADEQIDSLSNELAAALEDRANLVAQVRDLRQQVQQLKKHLRAGDDRYEALARRTLGEIEPASSERAFLLAIRLAHARMLEEHDRIEHPLRRMRIGPGFLRSVRQLDGVGLDKIVEVCAQVACGIAATLPAREVHQLREGLRGAGGRVRQSDGAKAWRCSLQDNTAAARRLHWWSIPGDDGGVIEFASVGLHDDFSIPE